MTNEAPSDSMDRAFGALANQHRRRMLDLLKASPGCNLTHLCDHFEISRIGVMKHLDVLETAGLVISERKGRERHLYFNVMPIQAIYDRWTSEYSALWATRLADLKHRVESRNLAQDTLGRSLDENARSKESPARRKEKE